MESNKHKSPGFKNYLSSQKYYYGTRADLKAGGVIKPGFTSNYGKQKNAKCIYLTATPDAAIWAAELALSEAPGRIFIVEPTNPLKMTPINNMLCR